MHPRSIWFNISQTTQYSIKVHNSFSKILLICENNILFHRRNTMEDFGIREARPEDCEAILGLIKELAVYEKMPEGPKIDSEVLRRDGFGEDRLFRCIVAETNLSNSPTVVGYALFFYIYSTWEGSSLYLEDLYVKPEHRGRGIGTALWREVAKICVKKNCVRMDWACLGWNTPSLEYYKRKGAIDLTVNEDWHLLRMKVKEIEAFANGES